MAAKEMGQGRKLDGRRMLVPRLEATPGTATGLMGSGICREMWERSLRKEKDP